MSYIGGDAQTSQSTAAWTSATGLNTALSVAVSSFATAAISFQSSGTITAGIVTFEISDAGSNWYPVQVFQVGSFAANSTYVLTGSNQMWMVPIGGSSNFRVRLSTVITGSGTATIGIVATVAPLSPTVIAAGSALPSGSNTIGAVTQASGPWSIQQQASTTGGTTAYRLISAATTNAASVKASAGQTYSIFAGNNGAAVAYLKLYNKASSPTVGTDTPVREYMIPGNAAGAGAFISVSAGMSFSTGIALAITGGIADSDTTAVLANQVVVTIEYN